MTAALIMAGGRGSRMAVTHPSTPKPLVQVGGIALLDLNLIKLAHAGIRRVYLALHHRADRIRAHVERSAVTRGLDVRYLLEETPRGTIGSLAQLREREAQVLVCNADLLSGIDLSAMLAWHRRQGANLTIATHDEYHRLTLGEVQCADDGTIERYLEKPVKRYRISSGTYLVDRSVLDLLDDSDWTAFPDLVNLAVTRGRRVLPFHHDAPWWDVNTAADLARAQDALRDDPVAYGIQREDLA